MVQAAGSQCTSVSQSVLFSGRDELSQLPPSRTVEHATKRVISPEPHRTLHYDTRACVLYYDTGGAGHWRGRVIDVIGFVIDMF